VAELPGYATATHDATRTLRRTSPLWVAQHLPLLNIQLKCCRGAVRSIRGSSVSVVARLRARRPEFDTR